VDGLFESGDTVEGAAANSPRRDLGEEPFDLVEPTRTRRREVNVVIGVALKPPPHGRGLVRSVVVHHEVNLLPGLLVERPVEMPQEGEKLLVPVLPEALADHGSGGDIEGGKEACRAVPVVVVRPPLGRAGLQRQQRLRAIECLHLALFVDIEHQGMVWRAHVQADDVTNLVDELWVFADLERALAMGLEAESPPIPADCRLDSLCTEHWDEIVDTHLPSSISHLFIFDGEQIAALAEQSSAAAILIAAVYSLLGLELVDRLQAARQALERCKQTTALDSAAVSQLKALGEDRDGNDRLEESLVTQRGELTNVLHRLQKMLADHEAEFRARGGMVYEKQQALQTQLNALMAEQQVYEGGASAVGCRCTPACHGRLPT